VRARNPVPPAYLDEAQVGGMPERNYMNQLFTLGYDQGRRGYAWMKYPPGLQQAIEADVTGKTAGKTLLRQKDDKEKRVLLSEEKR
jgi:hypothetical protein